MYVIAATEESTTPVNILVLLRAKRGNLDLSLIR